MKNQTSNKAAFTIVELMIVVSIIGTLAAISIPNLMKARHRARETVCINNLRLIDGASLQWALEFKAADNTPVAGNQAELYLRLGNNGTMPAEPETRVAYTWPAVGANPACPSETVYYTHVYSPGN